MLRWSDILENDRPRIISDVSDGTFLTFAVQNGNFKKISRKDNEVISACAARAARKVDYNTLISATWEGSYWHPSKTFKNIIDKNIPCIMMHKVKNIHCLAIDTVVVFMTGNTLDVFLVDPRDLTEWDPNEII